MFSSLCQTGCQVLGQSIPGNALLLALVTQGLETYHAIGHLVLPEDQGKARAALVGLLELTLKLPAPALTSRRMPGMALRNCSARVRAASSAGSPKAQT